MIDTETNSYYRKGGTAGDVDEIHCALCEGVMVSHEEYERHMEVFHGF